jgi:outer membrane protein assembly factor BamB
MGQAGKGRGATAMSVKGTLNNLGLEQLLRAELAAQGDGRLVLRNGAHYAAIHLTSDGAYIIHPDLLDSEALLTSLTERGVLDPSVMAQSKRHHLSDLLLLDSLLESGDLPEHELMEILAAEAEDTFLDLMLWQEGRFLFDRGSVDPSERGLLGRICVDPEGLCQRAAVRIDERRAIAEVLGQNALLFVAQTGELPPLAGPDDISHLVYARLNGTTVAHEVALQLHVGRFDVLRSIAHLVRNRLARPATPEELMQQATLRADAHQDRIARALVLQWAGVHPNEEGPLRKLASLAATARDKQAELEALCALGNQQLNAGNSQDALTTFKRAMRKAPADEVVLAGLQLAAQATGDNDSLVDGALLMAQTRLDEGQAADALEILVPVLETYPSNMGLHLMRARALVMLEKRSELLEQAELVGKVLGRDGSLTQVDKEAVVFFKTAIESVAPDRGDLLERFRSLYDPRRARRRRMALGFVTVLLLCTAGVYFWPASAATLLKRAQEAADAGDRERAGVLLAELTSRFPAAPELEAAVHLQNSLFPRGNSSSGSTNEARELRKRIAALAEELASVLDRLPAQAAREKTRALLDLMEKNPNSVATFAPVYAALGTAANRLDQEAVARMRLLAQTPGLNEEYAQDAERLRAFLVEADQKRDANWIADLRASTDLLRELTKEAPSAEVAAAVRELGRSAKVLDETAAFYDKEAPACRLTLAALDVEEADRRCKEEAPKLMVGGRFAEADVLYGRFESLLQQYAADPQTYGALLENLDRRQIPTFLHERRSQIADIGNRLATAKAAEARGDLETAVAAYASLIKQYWLIRFENVFTMPMRVESVPRGGAVYLNDALVGTSPAVVRYTWGSEATVRVEAPGWEPAVHTLHTTEEIPTHTLRALMRPRLTWRSAQTTTGTVGALRVGNDVLRADRDGTVVLHAGQTGEERWSVRARSLEGIRGRPALASAHLYVPHIDGEVVVLDPRDGSRLGTIPIARPIGDMAAVGRNAAVVTVDEHLIAFRDRREVYRKSLAAVPTAGLVAGHGAFWAGTGAGTVIRVQAESGHLRSIPLSGANDPVAALVATGDGVLVTTAAGTLHRLGPDGTRLWQATNLGDLVGSPAQADGRVVVVTRAGHVLTFARADGAHLAAHDMGPGASHGLLASGSTVFAARHDGSAWAFDLAAERVIIDGPIGLGANVMPALLDDGHVLVGLENGRVGVFPMPSLPPEAGAPSEAGR